MFSGWLLRSALCFVALSLLAYVNVRYFRKILKSPEKSLSIGLDTKGFQLSKPLESYGMAGKDWLMLIIFVGGLGVMLFGVFNYGWYLTEISAMFIIISVVAALAGRMSGTEIGETVLSSVAVVAPGAFMVGLATSIKVAMEMGNISDTIAFNLAETLRDLPVYASAVAMSLSQCGINFLIPSGSGQAFATLPIMIPLGDVLGLTRQTTILSFSNRGWSNQSLQPNPRWSNCYAGHVPYFFRPLASVYYADRRRNSYRFMAIFALQRKHRLGAFLRCKVCE